MRTAAPNTAIAVDPNDGADLRALTRSRLKELDRLRDLGFLQIERLTQEAKAIPQGEVFKALLGPKGGVADFDKLARAIRQIMVLEFELRGLFEAPDRDAPRKLRLVKSDRPGFEPPKLEKLLGDLEPLDPFNIRTDYRRGPMDQVVAGIRQTLGAEPPEDDPFASPPERAVAPVPQPPQPKPQQPQRAGDARAHRTRQGRARPGTEDTSDESRADRHPDDRRQRLPHATGQARQIPQAEAPPGPRPAALSIALQGT